MWHSETSGCHWTQRRKNYSKRRDVKMATLPKDATFGADESPDANGNDAEKSTTVATPAKDATDSKG
jgi:hypothetical protein